MATVWSGDGHGAACRRGVQTQSSRPAVFSRVMAVDCCCMTICMKQAPLSRGRWPETFVSGVCWGSVTHCPCAGQSPAPPEGPASFCGLYSPQKAELTWPGPGPHPKPCHCMAWGPKLARSASQQVLRGLASAWGAGGKGRPRVSWFFMADLPLTPPIPPEAPRRSLPTALTGCSTLWVTAHGPWPPARPLWGLRARSPLRLSWMPASVDGHGFTALPHDPLVRVTLRRRA